MAFVESDFAESVISEPISPLNSPISVQTSSNVVIWESKKELESSPENLGSLLPEFDKCSSERTRHDRYYFDDGNLVILVSTRFYNGTRGTKRHF